MMWQVIIHLTFVLSAMAMAFTSRLMDESSHSISNSQMKLKMHQ
jgi:uncharacterized membrane protein YqhA